MLKPYVNVRQPCHYKRRPSPLRFIPRWSTFFLTFHWVVLAVLAFPFQSARAGESDLAWPPVTQECRPWSYWWWLGSAVDTTNLTRELHRYREAGWGGVHIIPIYGAKGWEDRYIEYLSPQWMAMLRHTVREGERLGLGVDMTTGTGWCFGGPRVTPLEANAVLVTKVFELAPGMRLQEKLNRGEIQALVAFRPNQQCREITDRIRDDGTVDWTADGGSWRLYAISQKPSGQRVKRAAPGGAGHMLNLFYPPGMRNYLRAFEDAFAAYEGPKPRAMYHDSYEYNSHWAPDLFEQFARRRGYRLQTELPALLGKAGDERAARVKYDYRETLSDILVEETLPLWVKWCHDHGMRARNQAHGSPGNLLDLYALADMPETEMFHTDRNPLISKFASSAAHVVGRRFTLAETGTWLREHFTETLADMKFLLDDLFLSGVNQVVYHGTCYSPEEAPWPGWLFYASYEMNPRNAIWHDVPALNAYVARCQSVLQSGAPDSDLLLYWPIHDFWQRPGGMEQKLTVHAREWFEGQPLGKAAERLWQRGFSFDYISDRQLGTAQGGAAGITVPGGTYRVLVVPRCQYIPTLTMGRLLLLVASGATVIFEQELPREVPGWGHLEPRRAELKRQLDVVKLVNTDDPAVREVKLGAGRILVGELERALTTAGLVRETMVDHPGLQCLRRRIADGYYYFVANRGERVFDGWLPLAVAAQSVGIMDPLSGQAGMGDIRANGPASVAVRLALPPGKSMILRLFTERPATGPAWRIYQPSGPAVEMTGTWQVRFVRGGPQLPAPVQTTQLVSWTELGDAETQRFAGTAVYTISFDAPPGPAAAWILDLGKVCQSARVRLNDRDLGTLFVPPFQVRLTDLKSQANRLEVEVTNVSANRIRDLDRRKVVWKNFHDINFVNTGYKPFDAANWPLTESGLLGPVSLRRAE